MSEKPIDEGNILGCYVSITRGFSSDTEITKKLLDEQGRNFRTYIWGDSGISNHLKKLRRNEYGEDISLILFEFYVNPLKPQLENLKPVGNYRKKEKSVGIAIVVNEDNFFSKTEIERRVFLWSTVLERTKLLNRKKKDNKLDTDIDQLYEDIEVLWKKSET